MGWLWSSSASTPTSSPAPTDKPASASTPIPATISSKARSAQESEDAEVEKFLEFFKNDPSVTSPSASTSTSTRTSPSPASPASSEPSKLTLWLSSKFSSSKPADQPAVPHLSPLSESLLPTEISCRQAFDQAWACNSLGGQFIAVYREGEMRSCSHFWDDFWFCMRTKSYTGATKAEALREHYRRKEWEKYYAPGRRSSEDVWEARERRVQPGTAFAEAIEIAAVSDEEWRRQEDERRRKIREGLGYEKTS